MAYTATPAVVLTPIFLSMRDRLFSTVRTLKQRREAISRLSTSSQISRLEKHLKEGLPEFTLPVSHTFGKDDMEATLYFKKSEREGKEMYFFNKYDVTLKQDGRQMSETFYTNNKGQSITFKESCNLLNGRAVFKELAPKEGEKYKAWVKLDMSERDQNGNAKVKHFHENFGYDVKEALGRLPFEGAF